MRECEVGSSGPGVFVKTNQHLSSHTRRNISCPAARLSNVSGRASRDEICWLLALQQRAVSEDPRFLCAVVIPFSDRVCTVLGHLTFRATDEQNQILCNAEISVRCVDGSPNNRHLFVQAVRREACGLLLAHYRVDCHPHINSLHEVLLGERFLYLVFPPAHGDLHSHVRLRKRLRESEARRLFRQIAEAVRACHDQGIVLRDLKLRKFVFADPHR